MTKVNPSNENETKPDIFPWKKSNLTSFLICRKMLKYFKIIFIVSIFQFQCKCAKKTCKMKLHQTGNVQIWQDFSLFTKNYGISMTFEIYFLVRFVSNMNRNGNSFKGKVVMSWFYSVNVRGKWAYLTEKNSQAGAKITT